MNCLSCGHENPERAKFCLDCGTAFALSCPECATELPHGAKFCMECGARMAPAGEAPAPLVETRASEPRPALAPEPVGARKVVSILFADLVGSTALHERLDPESARRFMESYYDAARDAVQTHGGTVTQFLGDGVKAVFGIPLVKEDDAIRAVRAGVAMQEAFRALAEQQREAVGETGLRVAVNTGEVVAEGETEIIGDPVNVAARLQERGRDGDVVIGESTERIVGSQISLELLGSFDLKGRAEPVKAYRVLSLESGGHVAAPFVGRVEELSRIDAVYEQAAEKPSAHMAVLLGSPGLGKSRLIEEFTRRSRGRATVVAARCDAAGGATFAPIADALREHLGLEANASTEAVEAAVAQAVRGDDADRIMTGIVGLLTGARGAPEETFFVVRRFLASLAQSRPVVLIVDDLQWAEPLLLDLVEHLVQWGSDSPLLVLIGARPELREVRASLALQGGLVSDVLFLDGLDATAAMRLAAGVIGAEDLPAAVAAKVLATSEGNPLFIGELVRMLVNEGAITRDGDRWVVGEALATIEMPPTIHAVLAARIERLEPLDCSILECASVVGRHFSRSAVAGLLSGGEAELDERLESLQRAELIERDTGWFLGEPVLRFHHVLIRDAAYRRLLKGSRAELHERHADWIEARLGDSPDEDETIGRHLEEAHRLLGELGPIDAVGQKLGDRAAGRLSSAGRRALETDDVSLAASLFGRALERLTREDERRPDLTLDRCEALLSAGDVGPAAEAIDELSELVGDSERLRAWQTCFRAQYMVLTAPDELSGTVDEVATAATALASLGDSAGEAKGHFVHALAQSRLGQVGACEASLDRALAAARRADDRRRANTVLAFAPQAALWGPSPVTRASGRCLDVVRVLRITQGAPAVEAVALSCQGVLEALRGRGDAARRMIASGREMVEELGIAQRLYGTDVFAGLVALLEGDPNEAERLLRDAYAGLRDLGLGIDAARAAALLGRSMLAQDRIDEAHALSQECESLAGDDLKAAIAWRGVRAEALARQGEHDEAIALARSGVDMAATTDALLDHADARRSLAVALRGAGQGGAANAEDQRARALWEEKGATLLVERAADEAPVREAFTAVQRAPGWQDGSDRFRPNMASRTVARLTNALGVGDFSAARAEYRDDYTELNHPTGRSLDADGSVAGVPPLLRSPGGYFSCRGVATLGDSLVLTERRSGAGAAQGGRFDVGAYENDAYHLFEVDEGGLLFRAEVFAPDHLSEALARLYEWYAESLEGDEGRVAHIRATVMGRWGGVVLLEASEAEEVFHPEMEMVDHRTLGSWRARGRDEVCAQIESLREVASTSRLQDVAILAVEPTVSLRRMINAGVAKVGGGAFEREYLAIHRFADDGRTILQECFDVGDEASAFARFDELTSVGGGAPAERSPVRANAATRLCVALGERVRARDAAGLADLISAELCFEHHPTGVRQGKDGFVRTWRGILRAEGLELESEVLASLGPKLALHRRRLSFEGLGDTSNGGAGRADMDEIVVLEADEQGRCSRMDLFHGDRLRDAVVCFYEGYASSVVVGPDRDRAEAVACSIAAQLWSGACDPDEIGRVLDPSATLVDHRPLSTWSSRDAAGVVEQFRQQVALAPDFAVSVEEILGAAPGALAVRNVYHGSDRVSGGRFENHVCVLITFGNDGLVVQMEAFEGEDRSGVLARFGEVVAGGTEAERRPSAFENLATRAVGRVADAAAARNWARFLASTATEGHFIDRRPVVPVEVEGSDWLSSFRPFVEMAAGRPECPAMATRGERLALIAFRWTVAQGDVGESVLETLTLVEVDESGRQTRVAIFDRDDVDAAYVELDERHGAGEGAGVESHWAQRNLRAINGRDWDAVYSLHAEDLVSQDHRLAGWGARQGPVDFYAGARALIEMAPDARWRLDHVRVSGGAGLSAARWYGTREGGPFESPFVAIVRFDDDGRAATIDLFDPAQTDRAMALFRATAGSGGGGAVSDTPVAPFHGDGGNQRRVWNRADGLLQPIVDAWHAQDWQAWERVLDEGFRFSDRRPMILLDLDRAGWIDMSRRFAEMDSARLSADTVATRGDRLVLWRVRIDVAGGDVGDSVVEHLNLFEMHEDGDRLVRAFRFEMADVAAAYEELDALYEGGEGAKPSNNWRSLSGFVRAVERRDWEAVRGLCRDDFVEEDHRGLAVLGGTEGPDAWVANFRSLVDLAPDTVYRAHHMVEADRGYLVHGSWYGTREGGPYELPVNAVLELDEEGGFRRADMYDDGGTDVALERLAELRSPNATDRFDNAASRADRQFVDRFNARDWPGIEALAASELVFDERRRMSRNTCGREIWLEQLRVMFDLPESRFQTRLLATRGDRLALSLHEFEGQVAGGGGPLEMEDHPVLHEVDAEGRLVAIVLFDLDDATSAYEELDRRFEAQPAARLRAATGVSGEPKSSRRPGSQVDLLEVPPNRAFHSWTRWYEGNRAGDFETVSRMYAPGFESVERRRVAPARSPLDGGMGNGRWLYDGGWEPDRTLLATAGEGFMLQRLVWTRGATGEASEIELLQVAEVDDDGRFVCSVDFDASELAEAHDDLYRRYVARGGDGVPQCSIDASYGLNHGDLERVRRALCDDFQVVDHRWTGVGQVDGADAYMESARVMTTELYVGARVYALYNLKVSPRGRIVVLHIWGTNQTGGSVESLLIHLQTYRDGKIARFEHFELEDRDRAMARFDELTRDA